MQRHTQHRGHATTSGTHSRRRSRRAFTLIEFVGALALFVASVALIGGAATTSLTARGNLTRAGVLDDRINMLLEQAAGIGFADLAANTFEVPHLCDDLAGTGVIGDAAESCVQVLGRQIRVQWQVVLSGDSAGRLGGPAQAADAAVITASATNTDGVTVTRSRTVVAPVTAWTDAYDVLRVRVLGDSENFQGPLLLLNGTSFSNIVAAGVVDAGGIVTMRAGASACTVAAPCRLGLQPGKGRGGSDTHRLDPVTVSGDAGKIVLAAGAVTDAVVTMHETGALRLRIDAVSAGTGRRITSAQEVPVAGSVCVWVTFSDAGEREVPFCNLGEAGRVIEIAEYEPAAGVQLPLPAGVEMTLQLESAAARAGGECPEIVGQRWWDGAEWAEVASGEGVCTTWTWGSAYQFQLAGGAQQFADGAVFELEGGVNLVGELLWEGVGSFPGAPGPNEPVFSKPRDGQLCGIPACVITEPVTDHSVSSAHTAPVVGSVVSSDAPGIARGWPLTGIVVSGDDPGGRLTVTVGDADGDLIDVVATNVGPAMRVCSEDWSTCNPISSGTTIADDVAPGAELHLRANPASAQQPLTLLLTDATGRSRVETITLLAEHQPFVTQTFPAYGTQGTRTSTEAQQDVWVRVFSSDGTPSAATVEFAADAPVHVDSLSGSVTADAAGWAKADIDFRDVAAGIAEITVTVGDMVTVVPAHVEARPGTVTVSAPSANQGAGDVSALVTVLDAAGDPLDGAVVAVATDTTTGDPVPGVWAHRGACQTGSGGMCVTPIMFETAAPVGEYRATVSVQTWPAAGLLSGTASGSVAAAPARLAVGAGVIAQGYTADVTVTVFDGLGDPVDAGVEVTLDVPAGGLTVEGSWTAETDEFGKATFTLEASEGVPTGPRELTVAAGAAAASGVIVVTGIPASMQANPPAVELVGSEPETVTVTVYDAGNAPVAGVVVDAVVSGSRVLVSTGVSTGADGQVELTVVAQPGATVIDRTLTISVDGLEDLELNVDMEVVAP